MALTANLTASISGTITSAQDLGTATMPYAASLALQLTNGTGANQADVLFCDSRTLAASATEDLDLAGSLTGNLGGTLTFAKLKAILVKAASGNTNLVQVTRPASNGVPLFMAAGDGIAVGPNGVFFWAFPGLAGVTVTAGTGDLLTFTNSAGGTGVTYDVVLIGTSA